MFRCMYGGWMSVRHIAIKMTHHKNLQVIVESFIIYSLPKGLHQNIYAF